MRSDIIQVIIPGFSEERGQRFFYGGDERVFGHIIDLGLDHTAVTSFPAIINQTGTNNTMNVSLSTPGCFSLASGEYMNIPLTVAPKIMTMMGHADVHYDPTTDILSPNYNNKRVINKPKTKCRFSKGATLL